MLAWLHNLPYLISLHHLKPTGQEEGWKFLFMSSSYALFGSRGFVQVCRLMVLNILCCFEKLKQKKNEIAPDSYRKINFFIVLPYTVPQYIYQGNSFHSLYRQQHFQKQNLTQFP